MKRVNGLFLLMLLGIWVVLSVIISLFDLVIGIMVLIGLPIFFIFFGNSFTGIFAKKTMKKYTSQEQFSNYSTFTTGGTFTIGSILCIEEHTGRIGYVSYMNPFAFQTISAREITNIKSGHVKAPLGGTSLVYFEFYYNRRRVRIPTFTSSTTYSLQSSRVLEAMSKADAFCEILARAQRA